MKIFTFSFYCIKHSFWMEIATVMLRTALHKNYLILTVSLSVHVTLSRFLDLTFVQKKKIWKKTSLLLDTMNTVIFTWISVFSVSASSLDFSSSSSTIALCSSSRRSLSSLWMINYFHHQWNTGLTGVC